ncbi:NAD(+) diphosphatase [Maritimibacter alkaliphilus]|uniref:NAD(+) diphosphatase n=1 Tax=Maritimibacter alkaliphilus TaxID=404236 RepID=UPI001C93DAFA|nr:NAD(+) diphosphatase [Maritimibacter alkaliphilus]MBY6091280.1 NAD(+) diphosphatase [Maritimibacter alkaliphilus]
MGGLQDEVTFGGSGLDRAAELRGRDDLAALAGAGGACLLFWRGMVLMAGPRVARLPLDHPVLQDRETRPTLLGREEGALTFALDISEWAPDLPPDWHPGMPPPPHPEIEPGFAFGDLRAVMADLTPREAELAATARALFSWHSTHRFCSQCGQPSVVIQSGWQRSCPACGGQHFPRTDPVVIMLITRGNSVLLGRSPGWAEGMYSLLAGFVEPGETIEAAVRREVREEASIEVGAVRYQLCQPWAFPNSLMFGCTGEALSEEVTLDPAELEDARWFHRDEVAEIFSGLHPSVRRPRRGAIAEFILRNWLADRLD